MHDGHINTEEIGADYLAGLLDISKDKVSGFYGPGIIGTIETHIDDVSMYPLEDYKDCIVGEYSAIYSALSPRLSRYDVVLVGDKVPAPLLRALETIADKECLHESRTLARYARLHGYELGVHESRGYSQGDWHTIITLSPTGGGVDSRVSLSTFDALMWGDIYTLYMELTSPNGETYSEAIGGHIGDDSLPYGHKDIASTLHYQIMNDWNNAKSH